MEPEYRPPKEEPINETLEVVRLSGRIERMISVLMSMQSNVESIQYRNDKTAKKLDSLMEAVQFLTGVVISGVALLGFMFIVGYCSLQPYSIEEGAVISYPSREQTCLYKDGQIIGCFKEGE